MRVVVARAATRKQASNIGGATQVALRCSAVFGWLPFLRASLRTLRIHPFTGGFRWLMRLLHSLTTSLHRPTAWRTRPQVAPRTTAFKMALILPAIGT